MHEHLIFFDGDCAFCHRSVRHIIAIDRDERFLFAPLSGKTAEKFLPEHLRQINSLILVEHYQTERKVWIRSRAIFRIYWLIGHGWKLLGVLCFFPGFIGDLFYRWFAAHRHQFKLPMPKEPGPKDRFLL